mgnify:CR=1 FL=1
MAQLDDHGRPEPPLAAPEAETLLGFLDFQRATLGWKARGLDDTQLRTTTAASSLTIGALLSHLAWVEDRWFGRALHGLPPAPPWDGPEFAQDPRWEITSAQQRTGAELRRLWSDAVDRSRELTDRALADAGMDRLSVEVDDWSEQRWSLRWIVTHMIEEYARHNGHADLLREAIDGQTGE